MNSRSSLFYVVPTLCEPGPSSSAAASDPTPSEACDRFQRGLEPDGQVVVRLCHSGSAVRFFTWSRIQSRAAASQLRVSFLFLVHFLCGPHCVLLFLRTLTPSIRSSQMKFWAQDSLASFMEVKPPHAHKHTFYIINKNDCGLVCDGFPQVNTGSPAEMSPSRS